MKAGEELNFNGKTYIATLNLIQIFEKRPSCIGCSIGSTPSINNCPLKPDSAFLCGSAVMPIDEQIIFIEKV